MGFLDGPGQRPHPEDPAALRARLRQDYQANVRFGQDIGVARHWLWSWVRRPLRVLTSRNGETKGGS